MCNPIYQSQTPDLPKRYSPVAPEPTHHQYGPLMSSSNILPQRTSSLGNPGNVDNKYRNHTSTETYNHSFYPPATLSETPYSLQQHLAPQLDSGNHVETVTQLPLQSYQDSSLTSFFSTLSIQLSPQMQHQAFPSSSSSSLSSTSSATEPPRVIALPTLDSLQKLASILDTAEDIDQVSWAQDVLRLVDRQLTPSNGSGPTDFTHPDSPIPNTSKLPPPLKDLLENAVSIIIVVSTSPNQKAASLALYLKAKLQSSGICQDILPKNNRQAFKDFESSARGGEIRGWFRLGRDYEGVNDLNRAKDCYERGIKRGDCECTYRMGMAHLLGQLNLPTNPFTALTLLRQASDISSIDFPQPSYVYGMLLAGELSVPTEIPFSLVIPPNSIPSEALYNQWNLSRDAIEKAAYLSYPPAQYKAGFLYEHAALGTSYDPLISVNWYTYASKNGEKEADMALSKWFLCGAEGNFPKNENHARTFAEKAAKKNHPNGCFALGYYYELGVGGRKDLNQAMKWYQKASNLGNTDAPLRLLALSSPIPNSISMAEHEIKLNDTLVRRRTQAKIRSDRQSISRPIPTRGVRHEHGQIQNQQLPQMIIPIPQAYNSPKLQEWENHMTIPMPIALPITTTTTSPSPISPNIKVGEIMSPNINNNNNNHYYIKNQMPSNRPPIPHQSFSQNYSNPKSDENGRRPSGIAISTTNTSLSDLPLPEENSKQPQPQPQSQSQPKKEAATFAEMGFQSKPVEEDGCAIM
ncbi:uncharacterized protein I206_103625 [Kwoniella pini CBS 10737]|uniref:Chitin synthase regulator 3 n=1 Tax=Kwoniella pini CBS 10737 TaxID=1296096 RepID=A0A1B9I927_9TREE|nr:uncharacterized protein I206_01373 [Kwoniella pini CBS 10737]OCF52088.1 hypothetical protein I206_01373 [Kwoniella pini CBS 10737]